jgi:ubiquinol-cytochrome c reductase iron-sulfur subunit
MAPGQQIVLQWQGKPVFVVRRPPEALERMESPGHADKLRDPDSLTHQQPDYARNQYRSVNPEFLVVIGICTHLGCVPGYRPTVGAVGLGEDWPGGYFCACHGSRYDLAGRVFKNVPAPYNLPVPPHRFVDSKTLRIGENPTGSDFSLNSVEQM